MACIDMGGCMELFWVPSFLWVYSTSDDADRGKPTARIWAICQPANPPPSGQIPLPSPAKP